MSETFCETDEECAQTFEHSECGVKSCECEMNMEVSPDGTQCLPKSDMLDRVKMFQSYRVKQIWTNKGRGGFFVRNPIPRKKSQSRGFSPKAGSPIPKNPRDFGKSEKIPKIKKMFPGVWNPCANLRVWAFGPKNWTVIIGPPISAHLAQTFQALVTRPSPKPPLNKGDRSGETITIVRGNTTIEVTEDEDESVLDPLLG